MPIIFNILAHTKLRTPDVARHTNELGRAPVRIVRYQKGGIHPGRFNSKRSVVRQ